MSDEKIKFKKIQKLNHGDHGHVHDHHDHGHEHNHRHHHHQHELHANAANTAFKVGIALNLLFTIIEFFYGITSNSMALIADAGHNLSDVLGLVIAFIAALLIQKKANKKFTYGFKGSTILSALLNSTTLFIAVGAILWEAIHRLSAPSEIQTTTMMIVASIGIVINFTTAMMFHSHSHDDLNAKGAYLHLMSDAAISLGVVIAGFLIKFTGITIIDPIVSILISLIIIYGTWSLFKEALFLSINAVPDNIDVDAVSKFLMNINGVKGIHDLHIWAMSTTENALTVHLIIPDGINSDDFYKNTELELNKKFKIQHTTIQIEKSIECKNQKENCYHT